MAPDLTGLSDTHDHAIQTPPIVKGLAVALVVLAVGVALLGWYLNDRRHVSDRRNERERVAICAILRQIPDAGHPSISQAKAAFACH